MVASEPEPGRVLMETDLDAGIVTTFTCDPLSDGRQTRLTIATDWPTGPGLSGLLNRLFVPGILRRMYADELQEIARYLAAQGADGRTLDFDLGAGRVAQHPAAGCATTSLDTFI